MAEPAHTPPMDEILASIRRIITDDVPIGEPGRSPTPAAAEDDGDDVLELGEHSAAPAGDDAEAGAPRAANESGAVSAVGATIPAMIGPSVPVPAASRAQASAGLLSEQTQAASQRALSALSGLTLDPNAEANTLDGLVREMLRPMLKEWLDANLPEMVERLVAREVARISGR